MQDSRGTGQFDAGIYEAAKISFLEAGVPIEIAEGAARVIASDDITKPNLGRSDDDQDFVWQAWHYLVRNGND
jgi:hypothetical protein